MEVKKKKPFYKRWWFILIVVVLAIGAIGSDEDKGSSETTSTKSNTSKLEEPKESAKKEPEKKPEKEPEKELEPEIIVTAKEIINTFKENEVRGKQTYTGKYAEITGVVGSIGESFGQTYVTIGSGEDFELISLQCYFKGEEDINSLVELNKGDTITIVGTIGEQSLNISVKNCKIK